MESHWLIRRRALGCVLVQPRFPIRNDLWLLARPFTDTPRAMDGSGQDSYLIGREKERMLFCIQHSPTRTAIVISVSRCHKNVELSPTGKAACSQRSRLPRHMRDSKTTDDKVHTGCCPLCTNCHPSPPLAEPVPVRWSQGRHFRLCRPAKRKGRRGYWDKKKE